MWCSASNWDNENFNTSYMISINKYEDRSAYPSYKILDEDWSELIELKDNIWCQDIYDEWVECFKKPSTTRDPVKDEEFAKREATKFNVPFLKQDVVDWLNANVKDNARPYDQPANGWCMGNDSYRAGGSRNELSIFFYRRSDAMAFVKFWSVHHKPTTYLDYFKDIRKELINGKLVKVKR